jgi:MFS family permease
MTRIKLAILASSATMMGANALSPILAEVARAFPDQPASMIQMVVVLPGLVSLPFSLLAGRVASRVPRKIIVIVSLLVCAFGGLIPLAVHESMAPLLFASAVIGIGSGFLVPNITALISDHFDGHERGVMMGLQSTFVNGGGMVIAILGGLLARVFWPYAYLVFLLFVPASIAVALLLPRGAAVATTAGNSFSFNRTLVYISAVGLFFSLLNTAYSTNVAMYLDAARLGDASSAGVATSLMSSVGILAGLLFGRIFRTLRTIILPIAIGLMAAGMFLTFSAGSLPLVFAGGLLCGAGVASLMPLGMVLATREIPPQASAMAIAIFLASCSLGSFVSPFVINGLAGFAGGSIQVRFLVAGVGLLALFVITLGKEVRSRRQVYKAIGDPRMPIQDVSL